MQTISEDKLARMRATAKAEMARARKLGWCGGAVASQGAAGGLAQQAKAESAKDALLDAVTGEWRTVAQIAAAVPMARRRVGYEMARRYLLDHWHRGHVERRQANHSAPAEYRMKVAP